MRLGRSHFPWLAFVLLATAASALLYVANFHPERLPFRLRLPSFFGEVPPTVRSVGGTPLGLSFGIVAYLIFLFAAALGIRKKKRLWPIGHVQLWLKAHLWLTTLTLPLVLFHCGFRAGGTLTTWVLALYTIVMLSGIFGIAVQQFMPRLMKDRLQREVVFEEIPFLRSELLRSATKLREELRTLAPDSSHVHVALATRAPAAPEDPSVPALAAFLDDECLPYLAARRGDRYPLGDVRCATGRFRTLRMSVSADWHAQVDDIQAWCAERRAMDLQTKLQHWLHGWLLLHVPVSCALLILTGWHAWAGLHFSAASQ